MTIDQALHRIGELESNLSFAIREAQQGTEDARWILAKYQAEVQLKRAALDSLAEAVAEVRALSKRVTDLLAENRSLREPS